MNEDMREQEIVTEAAEQAMTTSGVQTDANESNMAANDFSQQLYDLIKNYQDKIPLVYMMKIMSAVNVDLMAALLGTNMEYVSKTLREEFAKSASKSEILIG